MLHFIFTKRAFPYLDEKKNDEKKKITKIYTQSPYDGSTIRAVRY